MRIALMMMIMKLCAICASVSANTISGQQPIPSTYVILGDTGVGKSTLANCILNGDGDALERIVADPFATSDDADSCTRRVQSATRRHLFVVDTPEFDMSATSCHDFLHNITSQVKASRRYSHHAIDALLFVIAKGQINQGMYENIERIQRCVFHDHLRANSLLIVNKCEPGWLSKDCQRNNKYMKKMMESVGGRACEFPTLRLTAFNSTVDSELRQTAIDQLVHQLDTLHVRSVDINTIIASEQEKTYVEYLLGWLWNTRPTTTTTTLALETTPTEKYMWMYLEAQSRAHIIYRLQWPIPAHVNRYYAGVYSRDNRSQVFLLPLNAYTQDKWHFMDYSSGNIITRQVNLSALRDATADKEIYKGGVYEPEQQRIYLIPLKDNSTPNTLLMTRWHFIDIEQNDRIVAYKKKSNGFNTPSHDPCIRILIEHYHFLNGKVSTSHWIDACSKNEYLPVAHKYCGEWSNYH